MAWTNMSCTRFLKNSVKASRGSQLRTGNCRALRPAPETATVAATGCGEEGTAAAGGNDTMSMSTDFSVSSNNSSSSSVRLSVRGLAFILASGPSRKGPGH
ncbi:hypothetical protein CDL12_06231 [Handroanthus impetiginosus]|uniref:Uncharacterized protein n=1 Tax=Handroanthus impetiginosus TaxID=429701 RepID=A0A2G9HUD5_9LAMI|nr:hypothetical protein CDL12_06231 [Handroanthus impetiginosus]